MHVLIDLILLLSIEIINADKFTICKQIKQHGLKCSLSTLTACDDQRWNGDNSKWELSCRGITLTISCNLIKVCTCTWVTPDTQAKLQLHVEYYREIKNAISMLIYDFSQSSYLGVHYTEVDADIEIHLYPISIFTAHPYQALTVQVLPMTVLFCSSCI